MRFSPTVPLLYFWEESSYIQGEGQSTRWSKVLPNPLFAEWRGSFGDRAISAQAVGVSDMATIRTFYHPELCEKLRRARVLVVKNGDRTAITDGKADRFNPNLYELWGGVDDVDESHQVLEFRVRRYEGK